MTRPLVLTLAITGALTWPLAAQVVRGSVVEEGTGAAVQAAMVVLLDPDGSPRTRGLTDRQGSFVLRAPGQGSWQLRVDRIGHVSTLSPIVRLEPGDTLVQNLEVGVEAIRLDRLLVQTGRRCTLRPDEGAETARLWQEVRKALVAAAWTEAMGVYRYRLTRFVREHDPRRAVDRPERIERDEGYWRWPFESLPVEDLVENGFVRHTEGDLMYSAPDANVLLSDLFLDTHCFRVHGEGRNGAVRGLLGLAFEPVPGRRRVPEVRGVLWVDPETAELRRLEYRYTRLHSVGVTTGEDLAGGTVVFEAMPNGAWIIREWSVRMPVVETTWARIPDLSAGGARGHSAVTLQEKGARVDEVWDGAGRVAFADESPPARDSPVAASEGDRDSAPDPADSAASVPIPVDRDSTEFAPIELEPLNVVTERRSQRLAEVGFFKRQKTASGPFIVAEQIEAASPQRLTDVLRGLPGVRVVSREFGYDVIMATGMSVSTNGRHCWPSIVLDGAVVRPGGVEAEAWTDLIHPMEVEGMEVYLRSVGLPVEVGGTRSPCGAIVIWTKR